MVLFLRKCLLIENIHLKKYLDKSCINTKNKKILLGIKYECIVSGKKDLSNSANTNANQSPIYLKDEDITPEIAQEIKHLCVFMVLRLNSSKLNFSPHATLDDKHLCQLKI